MAHQEKNPRRRYGSRVFCVAHGRSDTIRSGKRVVKETIFLDPGEDMRRWYRDSERDQHAHPYKPQPYEVVVELWYDEDGALCEMRWTRRDEWHDPDETVS
jgi:hypothetical protein